MSRMIDLIRNSQVPANLMQSAARGALSVPAGETIEILVYLALHHKMFGDEARLTLAGWDENASLAVAGDPKTSGEVLGYFVSLENLRISLLPALVENPSVSEETLDGLAVSGSREAVEVLLGSPRVLNSRQLIWALQTNPNLLPNEHAELGKKLAEWQASAGEESAAADVPDEVVEGAVVKYLEENAAELAAVKDGSFHALGMAQEERDGEAVVGPQGSGGTAIASADAAGKSAPAAAAAVAHAKKHPVPVHEERRDSTLQKIAKLNIQGRIALAMRGSKEERSILIRDSTKLVALAVLDSPKVSDGEVEKFALQKNVLEAVLRAIPMRRKFAKNYSIMRNLVFNPRTPLDLGLGLMKNLLIHDLKNLSGNKEVSDTIRKLALRNFKQKLEKKG